MPSPRSDAANEAFVGALTQGGGRHADLSPEQLELLGKQAANMYLNEKVSLNDAISKLAGAHTDINNEQVKRVCEFANTAVYLAHHEKNKVAGADSSYPQFVLADAGAILQDLNDGARPTVVTQTDIDYSRAPMKKVAMVQGGPNGRQAQLAAALDALFGHTEERVKQAEAEGITRESVVGQLIDRKTELSALVTHLHEAHGNLERMQKYASAAYYELAKRHVLDGGSFTDVLNAARSSGLGDAQVAAVVGPVGVQLLQEKVASARELQQAVAGLEKVAHRQVNPQHPLVGAFMEVAELNQELDKAASALLEADGNLDQVKGFIREKLHAPASR